MTVTELIALLQTYDPATRVTLYDTDSDFLLPVRVVFLPADAVDRTVDFVAITSEYSSGVEGHGPYR